jgi:hypothetical protein
MLRGWVLAIAAVALFPSLAHADSDGYYCIGPGFVAYELSSSGAASGHWLHIVRVSASKGIVRLPPIALPEFQVHGMTCRENAVDLDGQCVGNDSNGLGLRSSAEASAKSQDEGARSASPGNGRTAHDRRFFS